MLFGPLVWLWYMQSCFPKFVGVFQAFRGVKNDLDQKMSFVGVHPLMKSGQKGASQGEPIGINFFGLSMHFPHQLGKRDGKINWLGRSDLFGAFWATLLFSRVQAENEKFPPSTFRHGIDPKNDLAATSVLSSLATRAF